MPDEIVKSIFETIVIAPGNVDKVDYMAEALLLPSRIHRDLKRQRAMIDAKLRAAGYYDMRAVYKTTLSELERALETRPALIEAGEDVNEIESIISKLIARRNARHQQMQKFKRAVLAVRQIDSRLAAHDIALGRQKAARRARLTLRKDSEDLHDILIETLTNLGICYRYNEKGKEKTDKVEIEEMRATADTHFFRVAISRKALFGWKSLLPRNVNPWQIADEKTIFALEAATRRRVEVAKTSNNGLWIKVHRLASRDGIVNHVSYNDMMSSYTNQRAHKIPLPVGVGAGRNEYWVELAHYPHYLVAGGTGSGKSNFVRGWISTLISKNKPDALRLILVDLKEGTEFRVFGDAGIPHLVGDVIESPPALLDLLASLEQMRIDRAREFNRVYARDIDTYNQRVTSAERMPRIVVIIDEFAAIGMSSPYHDPKENRLIETRIKGFIRQLLAKARSTGIHILIATQTPYVEVIPGPDKANLSVRICGRMPTQAASRVVLDNSSAAELPDDIKGRMIISTSGYQWTIQTPECTDADVRAAIETACAMSAGQLLALPNNPEAERLQDGLSDERLLQMVIEEFDGIVSATKLWRGGLSSTGLLSFRELDKRLKNIAAHETIEHEGQRFEVVGWKGGKRLQLYGLQPPPAVKETSSERKGETE